jgi:hypothetical protein
MKLILEKWNKFLKEQELKEATQQEIEYLNDALEIPIEQLPFGNIFGDSYRIIEPLDSLDESSSFGVAMKALEKMGWEVGSPKDGKILCSKTKISHYIDGKGNQGISRKTISLNLPKVLSGIINFISNSREKLKIEAGAELFEGAKRWSEANKAGEDLPSEVKYTLPPTIIDPVVKFTADEYRKIMKFYDSQSYWLGTLSVLKFEDIVKDIKINFEHFENFAKYASDSFDDLLANMDQYIQKNYIIYSRHPVDVFRMSDHQGIISCHSLPSEKGKIGFDEYNKCALSEAYGNGMIAYIVPAKNFKMFPPTQESLDNASDEEIFYDKSRPSAGELIPTSRIRIKNVAFHKDENSEPIRIAVPQGKIYGSQVPGFLDAVNDKIAKAQEKEVKEIIKQGAEDLGKPTIFLSKFTRYGGSYQDHGYSVAQTLPMLFRKFNRDVVLQGSSVRYDPDVEEALIASIGQDSAVMTRERLNEIFSEHTRGFVTFEFDLNEGYEGEVTYEWTLNVGFAINVPTDANNSEIENAITDAVDNDFQDYYQLPESDSIFVEENGEDSRMIIIVYNGYDLDPETFYLEGLEESLPGIMKKFDAFDHYYEDGPIQMIEFKLEEHGVIETEKNIIQNVLQDYDLPNDSWWPEAEREEESHYYFGAPYISSISFQDESSVDVSEIKEKIPENMLQNAYELIAKFLNTIFSNDEISGKLALNQNTWNKETDPNIVLTHIEPNDVTPEQIEESDEIEFKAGVSMHNDYSKEILQKTGDFLKNNASIDNIAERIQIELEKYLAKMLNPQQNITENKKRLRIRVRR